MELSVEPPLRSADGSREPTVALAKRYFCPACRRASLALIHDGGPHVARCDACAWATDDLLSLIPTKPAGMAAVALGSGAKAGLRAGLFLATCGALLALVLVGR